MFHRFHDRFGTAGVLIAVIALVAALGGTALAAGGALSGKQKKEVEKIAKKVAGKPGAPGTNGTNGAPGEKGAAGTNGTNGTPAVAVSFSGEKTIGSVTCKEGGLEVKSAEPTTLVCNGKKGGNGTNGTNAEAIPFTGEKTVGTVTCTEGGLEVISAGEPTLVCNGNPWTAGGTLPKGSTETGAWAVTTSSLGAGTDGVISISFSIPLATVPTFEYLKVNEQETTNCPGTAEEPAAAEGFLCVYTAAEAEGTIKPGQLLGKYGAVVLFETPQPAVLRGSWAVTAG